jgi:hypothetical protein
VNDEGNIINMDTASSNICCDKGGVWILFEVSKGSGSNRLGFSTVKCANWHTDAGKLVG